MDEKSIQSKLVEADSLVEAIPEARRSEARIAVLTALLMGAGHQGVAPVVVPEILESSPRVSSIRQLSRITKRKGILSPEVALLLAWFLKATEKRGMTAKDCRAHWTILTHGPFTTTYILRAESKGWLSPSKNGDEPTWELTKDGYEACMRLQQDQIETAKK